MCGKTRTARSFFCICVQRKFLRYSFFCVFSDASCACPNNTSTKYLVFHCFVLDSFLFNWLDLLAFSLSGLKAEGTSCAAMAYVMADLHREGAKLGRVAVCQRVSRSSCWWWIWWGLRLLVYCLPVNSNVLGGQPMQHSRAVLDVVRTTSRVNCSDQNVQRSKSTTHWVKLFPSR